MAQQTNINEFDDSHRPPDTTHKVVLFIDTRYPDAGTLASYGGNARHNETFSCVVATVSPGYIFEGWFSDHRIVSKDPSYDFIIDHDVELQAKFIKVYEASFKITQTSVLVPMDMVLTPLYVSSHVQSETWTIIDAFTKKNYPFTIDNEGNVHLRIEKGVPLTITHTISYSSYNTLSQTTTIVANDDVTKTFTWRYQKDNIYTPIANLLSFNSGAVTWNVLIPITEYYYATVNDIPRYGGGAYARVQDYVTYDSRVIVHMAENLTVFTQGMSDLARAEFVLKFVQSIPYVEDKVSKGQRDYWKFPVETLWEKNGDCEDHAVLLAALLKALGYDVVLHHVYVYQGSKLVSGHVAVGVVVEGGSGYSTIIDGKEYFYCEGTAEVGQSWLNQANVGFKPPGFEVVETWKV